MQPSATPRQHLSIVVVHAAAASCQMPACYLVTASSLLNDCFASFQVNSLAASTHKISANWNLLLQEAAELYERGGMPEKAASIYIQTKAFALAAPLMRYIAHSPQLQLQFAKAQESKHANN